MIEKLTDEKYFKTSTNRFNAHVEKQIEGPKLIQGPKLIELDRN